MLKLPTLLLSGLSGALALDMLVVGDWGGVPFPPYSTPSQREVADGMGKVGEALAVSAVLALGDNFYFDGIKTNSSSHRFEDTWNKVYPHSSLQVPWYLIAGNHDHYGNVTAQLEFAVTDARWNFPTLYYTEKFSDAADGSTLDVIFIDTIDLAGNTVGQEEDPGYYAKLPFRAVADAAEQWTWIAQQMAASTADHLVVAGHFPVYSVCEHGNTGNLYDNLRPLLIEHGAHYLSGHDHCL
jgi:tartrate-resistant acid phosphatase type 5